MIKGVGLYRGVRVIFTLMSGEIIYVELLFKGVWRQA